mmetsp:Transcript_2913/g.7954  ORF Transcript_2913/g.7954 Transcript_2913/m.7954 type:complete len:213 (+) Transcript_2913:858-1496(+)
MTIITKRSRDMFFRIIQHKAPECTKQWWLTCTVSLLILFVAECGCCYFYRQCHPARAACARNTIHNPRCASISTRTSTRTSTRVYSTVKHCTVNTAVCGCVRIPFRDASRATRRPPSRHRERRARGDSWSRSERERGTWFRNRTWNRTQTLPRIRLFALATTRCKTPPTGKSHLPRSPGATIGPMPTGWPSRWLSSPGPGWIRTGARFRRWT